MKLNYEILFIAGNPPVYEFSDYFNTFVRVEVN